MPNQAVPILSKHFPHKDDAYHEVALGIKQTAQNMLEKKREQAQKAAEDKAILAKKHAVEAEKVEKGRHRNDEADWKHILAEAENTSDPDQLLLLFNAYLDVSEHLNYLQEAEDRLADIQAEIDAHRKLEAAKQVAQHKKEEAAKASEAKQKWEATQQKDLPEMIFVKGGTFLMGEKGVAEPVHSVTLSDFAIGKYPVTQKLWQEVMGSSPSLFKGDDLPVESISWGSVKDFLKKLNDKFPGQNYRLPTEAEWEFAARGGTLSKGYPYAGNIDLQEVGWCWENSGDKTLNQASKPELFTKNNCRTHPVGQKKPNELGLYDMSGNVWEWCIDWDSDYPAEAKNNPQGPEEGTSRVFRGGSWYSSAHGCRLALRSRSMPGRRFSYLGFRLASSPQ